VLIIMKFGVLIFNDEASQNVLKYLGDLPSNAKIYHIDSPKEHTCVYCENVDEGMDADILLFITTHNSASGVKSLSLHTQGNWGKAELGGNEKELGVAPALYLKEGFKKLVELCDIPDYDVIQECTHHGPSVGKPVVFIEIGSSEKEWGIKRAGEINAAVIKHLVSLDLKKGRTAVGIGGPHHTPNFRKIQLNTNIAIGHVCPMYNLENLDATMLRQALDKTFPPADLVIIDWKGLKSHKEKVKAVCEEVGVEWKKTKDY